MKRRFASVLFVLLFLGSFPFAQETATLPYPKLDAALADANYETTVLGQIDAFLKSSGASEQRLVEAETALRELLLVHLKAREHLPYEKSANDHRQAVLQQITDRLL